MSLTILARTLCIASTAIVAWAQPATFTLIPLPNDVPSDTHLFGIACSADVSVIAVQSSMKVGSTWVTRMYRWSWSGGYSPLPSPAPSTGDTCAAMSPDSTYILGATSEISCLWTGQNLPALLPVRSVDFPTYAYAMSDDAAVIVGTDRPASGYLPLVWTGLPRAVSLLPLPSGYPGGSATAISGDGTLIGGFAYDPSSPDPAAAVALVWHLGVPKILPSPPGYSGASADAISADGSTIVGTAYFDGDRYKACQWDGDTGVRVLPTPTGAALSQVTGLSADGSVMVGFAGIFPSGDSAALWKHSRVHDLKALLQSRGGELGDQLLLPFKVSADGKTVIGWTFSPTYRAFVATLPNPLCLGDFDDSGGTPDATDISAFFSAWLLGDPTSDADGSGGTPDGSDIARFFDTWLAGGC